jgi:hypothetical protein
LALEAWVGGTVDYFTDKLVPQYAAKWIVASYEFEVRGADPGQPNSDQRLISASLRLRQAAANGELLFFEPDSSHGPSIAPARLEESGRSVRP